MCKIERRRRIKVVRLGKVGIRIGRLGVIPRHKRIEIQTAEIPSGLLIDRADKYRFAFILRKIELIIVEPERRFGVFEQDIAHPCEHNVIAIRGVFDHFEIDVAQRCTLVRAHGAEFEGDPAAAADDERRACHRFRPRKRVRRPVYAHIIVAVVVRFVLIPIGAVVAENARHAAPARNIFQSAVRHAVRSRIDDAERIGVAYALLPEQRRDGERHLLCSIAVAARKNIFFRIFDRRGFLIAHGNGVGGDVPRVFNVCRQVDGVAVRMVVQVYRAIRGDRALYHGGRGIRHGDRDSEAALLFDRLSRNGRRSRDVDSQHFADRLRCGIGERAV